MFERFTDAARTVMGRSMALAEELRSPFVRRHHMLYALLGDAEERPDAIPAQMFAEASVDVAAFRMEVVDDAKKVPPVCREFEKVVERREPGFKVGAIERFQFYDRCKGAFAIVATGERRLYGNLILKKGIIRPEKG